MKTKTILLVFFLQSQFFIQAQTFTKEDRERAIRTEIMLQEYIKSNEKRLDGMDKRIENIESKIDTKIEASEYRITQNFYFVIGILCTIMIAVFTGFYFMIMKIINGERHTIKAEIIEEISHSGKIVNMINEIKAASYFDSRVENILKKYGLLPNN
jgi:tetrahydromethanopterin S-methyltransferase subunit G